MGGLAGVGARTALLGTQEVIELLYASYNPEEATKERLTNFEEITGVYVHPTKDSSEESAQGQPQETPAQAQNPLAHIAPEPQTAEAANNAAASPDANPNPAPTVEPPSEPAALTTPPEAAPAQQNSTVMADEAKPAIPSTDTLTLPTTLPETAGPTNVAVPTAQKSANKQVAPVPLGSAPTAQATNFSPTQPQTAAPTIPQTQPAPNLPEKVL